MKNTKKMYVSPSVERVLLDHQISLILQSAPPDGPGEILSDGLDNTLSQNRMMV
jgi:hypothetical protein